MRQLPASAPWGLLGSLADGDRDGECDVARRGETIDRLAADGDAEELASVFAPRPGRRASVYRVEQRAPGEVEADQVEVFDDPVHAWQAFRVVGSNSRALVSVTAELHRTIATLRPDGDLQIPVSDSCRLDDPDVEPAARRWWYVALAQRPTPRPARQPPAAIRERSPLEEIGLGAAVDAAPALIEEPAPARINTLQAADTLGARLAEPEPSPPRTGAIAALETQLRSRLRGVGWAHVAIGAVAVVLGVIFIRFTIDDAFVSWRYGSTLVHTGHWNWNRSGPTVEAYSNFLYTALSVVPALLRIPTEVFFKLVSLGIIGGYIAWVRRLGLPSRQRLVLFAVALASPVFYIQLFSGLETVSFALLIAVVFATIYRTGRLNRWGYVAVGALALSRPEGIAFAAAAMAWVLVIDHSKSHVRGTAAVLSAFMLYWIWRAQHFGWFWPNAFYAKSDNRGSLIDQFTSVMNGLLPGAAIAVLVVVAGRLLSRQVDRRAVDRPRRSMLQDATPVVLAVLGGLVILFLYKQSDPGMDFANRFVWQLLFPIVVVVLARPIGPVTARRPRVVRHPKDPWALAAVGIATMTAVAYNPAGTSRIVVLVAVATVSAAAIIRLASGRSTAIVVAAVGLAVLISWVPVADMVGWAAYRYRLQYAHEAMGHVLDQSNITGAVAIGDAGILPFALHQPVIDVNGLANAGVAHGTFTAADLRRQHLQFVVALSTTPDPSGEWQPTIGQQVTYSYAPHTAGFWFSQGPQFSSQYWLNFWIQPKLAKAPLLHRLQAVTNKSMTENSRDDGTLLSDHLFDFPFLTGR